MERPTSNFELEKNKEKMFIFDGLVKSRKKSQHFILTATYSIIVLHYAYMLW